MKKIRKKIRKESRKICLGMVAVVLNACLLFSTLVSMQDKNGILTHNGRIVCIAFIALIAIGIVTTYIACCNYQQAIKQLQLCKKIKANAYENKYLDDEYEKVVIQSTEDIFNSYEKFLEVKNNG